jgi:NADH:ubiquinone oxidoreductase subunit 4 (subunit M)
MMLPLVAAIVWLGVYPAPVLRRMESSAARFVTSVAARSSSEFAAAGGRR